MGDSFSFFSSQSPDSSHGYGSKRKSQREKNFGPPPPPWKDPGAYRNGAHIRRIRAEMQRLVSTDGPKTSWLFSEQSSKPQKSGASGSLQKKLTVGSANDPLEKEADAVAERVMLNPKDCYLDPPVSPFRPFGQRSPAGESVSRENVNEQEQETAQMKTDALEISRMPDEDEAMQPNLQRECAACEEEDMQKATLQREARGPGAEGGLVSEELQQRIDGVRNTGGEKLPESEREFFESRMGHDFGDVRIHTGSEATQVSRAVNAKAFTIGRDVVFGEGEYKPGTSEGRRLMAHELTHTMQQGTSSPQSLQRRETPPTIVPPGKKPPIPGYFPRKQGARALWRHFGQAIIKRFALRGSIAAALAAVDGPFPVGDLIALGMAVWTAVEIALIANELWTEAEKIAQEEGLTDQEVERENTEPEASRLWNCTSKCNIAGTAPDCQGRTTESMGTGKTQEAACRDAKHNAGQLAPRGCYPRHCQCPSCWRN